MSQANALETSRFVWRALRSRFRDHRAELSAIRSHINPCGIVCDVGANKGSFLFWLARWCTQGRVVAFEPQQDLAQYLSRMCSSLGLRNVTVEAKAVFSEAGEREFFIPDGHKPGASLSPAALSYASILTVSVPVVTLDEYFLESERVSVLKIDVEGAEAGVFEGAARLLERDRPLLVFECEARHLASGQIGDVFKKLEKIGYHGTFVERGRIRPVSQFQEQIHQSREGEWFWKQSGYCPNFIFSANRVQWGAP
ncbi:FkbM family methyltransferase [Bradyrhizobium barranii]|uniref:FkbM family methyltransferase n=1 Tax=Bradyrhizobium barranii TaxID=2992140 RepID=UPI004034D9D3